MWREHCVTSGVRGLAKSRIRLCRVSDAPYPSVVSVGEALSGGFMFIRIRTGLRRDEGASAVEYGLLLAAIAALIVVVIFLLGGKVSSTFAATCSGIGSGTC